MSSGDLIVNYDSYEEMWDQSFRVLKVRDKYKNTTGGGGTAGTNPQNRKGYHGGTAVVDVRDVRTAVTPILNGLLLLKQSQRRTGRGGVA